MKRFKLEKVKEVFQENNYIIVVMKNEKKLVLYGGEATAHGIINYLRDYDKFMNDDKKYPLGSKYVVYEIKNDLYYKLLDMCRKQ